MARSLAGSVFSRSALALSISAALALLVPVGAMAQDAAQSDPDVSQLEAVTVTGSRLSKADSEEALPVTVYTEADIRATGQPTVAEVLRTLPYNSQGSATPRPGSTGQGVTDVNLRGLGDGRTLILVNGRRVPVDATYFGFAVSTSFIPVGAVERIEVLRDGASAIYGSDAIGGVVNIVLRKEFSGTQVSVGYDSPVGSGGNTLVANATTGTSGKRGGFVLSVEKRKMDPVENRHRSALASDWSNLGFGFLSNSFPPTWRANDFFGDGSNVAGPYATVAGCDASNQLQGGPLTLTNPLTDQSVVVPGQVECRNPVADKTDHVPEFDVTSAYLSGNWKATANLKFYGEALLVNQNSVGRRESITGTSSIAADNPNNPTRNATAGHPVGGVTSPRDISVLYALPDEYGRILEMKSRQRNFVGGFDWAVGNGMLSGHYQYASQGATSLYRNALHTASFNAAVASGALNLFDPGSVAAYAPYMRTGERKTTTILKSSSLNWTASLPFFELPGGSIGYGVGYEWRTESIDEHCDALSTTYAITGSFCLPFGTEREIHAGYVEASLPVLDNLEVNYAGRWDNYDVPSFKKLSNRVAVRYQPLSFLTLRGSYSEGIRAPNLYEINSSSGITTSSVVDTKACAAVGGNPTNPACFPVQVTQILKGGPNLSPERSKSVSWGVVWSPNEQFNLAMDYYKVRIDDQIQNIGNQVVLDLEAQGLDLARYSVAVERDANGNLVSVTSGSANVPGFSTSGVDTEATLNLDFGGAGRLQSRLLVSWIKDYERPAAPGAPSFDAVGYVSQPHLLGSLNNTWYWSEWSANLRWNYTGGYDARTPEAKYVLGVPSQGRIAAYQTVDLMLTYQAPWNARISVGARNIANSKPDINRYAFGNLAYNTALADINGRVMMFNYTQSFE